MNSTRGQCYHTTLRTNHHSRREQLTSSKSTRCWAAPRQSSPHPLAPRGLRLIVHNCHLPRRRGGRRSRTTPCKARSSCCCAWPSCAPASRPASPGEPRTITLKQSSCRHQHQFPPPKRPNHHDPFVLFLFGGEAGCWCGDHGCFQASPRLRLALAPPGSDDSETDSV